MAKKAVKSAAKPVKAAKKLEVCCKLERNKFCYVCGQYVPIKMRREFSKDLQKLYKATYDVTSLKNAGARFAGKLSVLRSLFVCFL